MQMFGDFTGGGNAEYAAVHEDHVMPVHDNLTFSEAGAIPEVWLTAYQLLHFVGGHCRQLLVFKNTRLFFDVHV